MAEEKKSVRYAEAMDRLQAILEEIGDSAVGVDELSDRVKEAAELIRACKAILGDAKKGVEEALKGLEETEEADC